MSWDDEQFIAMMEDAAETYDRDRISTLCEKLINHIHTKDECYPRKEASQVLQILRRKRYFALMQRVADAVIQSGQDAPKIRRHLAQSLLDQGNMTSALSILNELVTDSTVEQGERIEARGLIGRAYKQLYVDAGDKSGRRTGGHLENAIHAYYQVYRDDKALYWHGINTVALLCRAKRDGRTIAGFQDPAERAHEIAADILRGIEAKPLGEVGVWDFGTAAEACIALGRPEEALKWIGRYASEPSGDAFEYASTFRQLTEVWQLNPESEPEMKVLRTLQSALLRCKGGQIEIDAGSDLSDSLTRLAEDGQFEKAFTQDGFRTFKWYATGAKRAAAVGILSDKFGRQYGTGFLVRGKDLCDRFDEEFVLLTNSHVLSQDPKESGALPPEDAAVRFEVQEKESPVCGVTEIVWSSHSAKLDATVARLTTKMEKVDPYPVAEKLPDPDGHQRVFIMGHPSGSELTVSIYDNVLLDHEDPKIHYRAPTEEGSSGSPVFNDKWELIGLHHAGWSSVAKLNGKKGRYSANEGIWIQAIMREL